MSPRRSVLYAVVGLAAISFACSRHAATPRDEPAPSPATGVRSATSQPPAQKPTPTRAPVTYAVHLELRGDGGRYTLTWNDGNNETLTGSLQLPWTHDNPRVGPGRRASIYVDGQPGASFSCTISINGKVVSQDREQGRVGCTAFTPQ